MYPHIGQGTTGPSYVASLHNVLAEYVRNLFALVKMLRENTGLENEYTPIPSTSRIMATATTLSARIHSSGKEGEEGEEESGRGEKKRLGSVIHFGGMEDNYFPLVEKATVFLACFKTVRDQFEVLEEHITSELADIGKEVVRHCERVEDEGTRERESSTTTESSVIPLIFAGEKEKVCEALSFFLLLFFFLFLFFLLFLFFFFFSFFSLYIYIYIYIYRTCSAHYIVILLRCSH